MPIVLNAIGTSLDVTIIDSNMVLIQDLLRSGVVKADILGQIRRYTIRRYASGRLVATVSGTMPIVKEGGTRYQVPLTTQVFDLTYRPSGSDGDMTQMATRANNADNDAMELLGRPGPTPDFQFQEDGFPDPPTQYGFPIAGWPPAGFPSDRYDKRFYYSKWLTVPGASTKVFIKYPGVMRITGMATGSLTMFAMMHHIETSAAPTRPHVTALEVERFYAAFRFALIVDTNPILDTEWNNTNPNILDPVSGAQAANVSWQVLEDRTYYAAQRESFHMDSEIFLQGGKHYNVRLAFRPASTEGFVWDNVGTLTWSGSVWEQLPFAAGGPAVTLWPPAANLNHPFHPPWISLWDSAQLSLEMDYARSNDWANHHGNAGIQDKATYP